MTQWMWASLSPSSELTSILWGWFTGKLLEGVQLEVRFWKYPFVPFSLTLSTRWDFLYFPLRILDCVWIVKRIPFSNFFMGTKVEYPAESGGFLLLINLLRCGGQFWSFWCLLCLFWITRKLSDWHWQAAGIPTLISKKLSGLPRWQYHQTSFPQAFLSPVMQRQWQYRDGIKCSGDLSDSSPLALYCSQ